MSDTLIDTLCADLDRMPPAILGGSEPLVDDDELNEALDRVRDMHPELVPYARQRLLRRARATLDRVRPDWTEGERRSAVASLTREVTPTAAPAIAWIDTPSIFADLPATPWVSRGLMLAPGRPALLAGYGASAKTLAAQSLALAVASGRPIWGLFEVSDPGRVLHFDYEQGEPATRRRYQRLAIGHGIDAPELGDRLRLAALPRVYLDAADAGDVFARELDGAQLAIIDSLRAAAPRLDENASDVRSALDALTTASAKTGCAVLVIHHAGKTQDRHADTRQVVRGSSAIFDAAGCALIISAGKSKTDPRHVTQAKVPAEAEGAPIEDFDLTVDDVALGADQAAGVRITAIRPTPADPRVEIDAAVERDCERVLAVVREQPGCSQRHLRAHAGLKGARADLIADLLVDNGRLQRVPAARGGKSYLIVGGQS